MERAEQEGRVLLYFQKVTVANINKDFKEFQHGFKELNKLAQYDREVFNILGESRLGYLRILYKNYKNNNFTRNFKLKLPDFEPKEYFLDREIKTEKDFKDYLCENNIITELLGLQLLAREYPSRFGSMDMLYREPRVEVPCEVKLGEAKHDLITQIEKYLQCSMGALHYFLYDKVYGITLAEKYNDFCIKELKELDVLPIIYTMNKDKVLLRRAFS